MNPGRKPFSALLVPAAGLLAFGAGLVVLSGPKPSTSGEPARHDAPASSAVAETQQTQESQAGAANALTADDPGDDPPPQADAPATPEIQSLPTIINRTPDRGRVKKPAPTSPTLRPLTPSEKAALQMLGTAEIVHDVRFRRPEPNAGPPPSTGQARDLVLGKIRAEGLPDGFEEAVLTLAPQGLVKLLLPVTRTPTWAEVQAVAGTPAGRTQERLTLPVAARVGSAQVPVTWYHYGWLQFGVTHDRVQAIRAELRVASRGSSAPAAQTRPVLTQPPVTRKPPTSRPGAVVSPRPATTGTPAKPARSGSASSPHRKGHSSSR